MDQPLPSGNAARASTSRANSADETQDDGGPLSLPAAEATLNGDEIAEASPILPAEWDVQTVSMAIDVTRVWIPLSETTAELLAVVLARAGVSVDSWVAEKAMADATTVSAGAK